MFRTEKPWLDVYERGNVEPESRVFGGSLYDLFRQAAEEHRGRNALSFYGTTFEFRRLHALVEKMAASLAASGVSKGDRVALMLPNCPQYVISFFATVREGKLDNGTPVVDGPRKIGINHTFNNRWTQIVYAPVTKLIPQPFPKPPKKEFFQLFFFYDASTGVAQVDRLDGRGDMALRALGEHQGAIMFGRIMGRRETIGFDLVLVDIQHCSHLARMRPRHRRDRRGAALLGKRRQAVKHAGVEGERPAAGKQRLADHRRDIALAKSGAGDDRVHRLGLLPDLRDRASSAIAVAAFG
jgi:hypothetical protein